ncbi:DUF6011 domain-containing protein [Nocardia sp. NPDC050710]|uniref:DUF6011 domain-containing protein n=1 Tax=Nocardia sp. NPDC050710 TaxID=3157220 RepID=UPI003409B5DB
MGDTDDRPTVKLVTHCRRCHGWLVSAASVAQGIGPTCAIRERAEQYSATTQELTLFNVAAQFGRSLPPVSAGCPDSSAPSGDAADTDAVDGTRIG